MARTKSYCEDAHATDAWTPVESVVGCCLVAVSQDEIRRLGARFRKLDKCVHLNHSRARTFVASLACGVANGKV